MAFILSKAMRLVEEKDELAQEQRGGTPHVLGRR
jgi:hypothetical protein